MALYSIIQYISVTLLYSVRSISSKMCSWEIQHVYLILCRVSLLFLRSSATLETFSSSSLILPLSSLLFLPVSVSVNRTIVKINFPPSGCVLLTLTLPFYPICAFCSESECSMERIGLLPPPIGSYLSTFAALCNYTDPHLFRLPDLYLPFG